MLHVKICQVSTWSGGTLWIDNLQNQLAAFRLGFPWRQFHCSCLNQAFNFNFSWSIIRKTLKRSWFLAIHSWHFPTIVVFLETEVYVDWVGSKRAYICFQGYWTPPVTACTTGATHNIKISSCDQPCCSGEFGEWQSEIKQEAWLCPSHLLNKQPPCAHTVDPSWVCPQWSLVSHTTGNHLGISYKPGRVW